MILVHPTNYNFPLYFAFTSLSYRNEMYDNNNSQTKEARLKHTMITRHRLLQSSPLNKCLKLYYILCVHRQHLPTLIIQKEYLKLPLVRRPYDAPSQYCEFFLSSLRLLPNDKRMCGANEGNLEAAPLSILAVGQTINAIIAVR